MRFKQKWQGRNCNKNAEEWFPASVPGNIQYDYGVFHQFEDVQYADNYKQYLPLEEDHWEYRTRLSYEKRDGERVFFVSGGIDYRYDVLLNGEKVYSYEGMFRPFEIDLSDRLKGEDTLTVHIYPHPKSTTGRNDTRYEADASCKPPVMYGWDWNPRLLISGLWHDAYIETRGESYIGACEVLADLSDDLKTGTVTYDFE
jgi:beta-mannosidase